MAVQSLQTVRPAPKSGIAILDFGPFPGSPLTRLIMVGWADTADPNARVVAWVQPIKTTDHAREEHSFDPPMVSAQMRDANIVIYGMPSGRDRPIPPGVPFGNAASQTPIGQRQPMPYGQWSVGWAILPGSYPGSFS
jgi:hypothetical protein